MGDLIAVEALLDVVRELWPGPAWRPASVRERYAVNANMGLYSVTLSAWPGRKAMIGAGTARPFAPPGAGGHAPPGIYGNVESGSRDRFLRSTDQYDLRAIPEIALACRTYCVGEWRKFTAELGQHVVPRGPLLNAIAAMQSDWIEANTTAKDDSDPKLREAALPHVLARLAMTRDEYDRAIAALLADVHEEAARRG